MRIKLQIDQVVYWVHCTNKVYKGTIKEYSFCENQGAVYLSIHSPSFRINPYPTVHYSHCFASKERALEFAEALKEEGSFVKRCDRCEFENKFKEDTK